jgi:hypothetical protein
MTGASAQKSFYLGPHQPHHPPQKQGEQDYHLANDQRVMQREYKFHHCTSLRWLRTGDLNAGEVR